jgi:hypothetical protein
MMQGVEFRMSCENSRVEKTLSASLEFLNEWPSFSERLCDLVIRPRVGSG